MGRAEPLGTRVPPESSRRMLDAAVAAFAARGFHATTTRDIAARAGLSPAALYVHYPSKAALLAQISLDGHEEALALVVSASDAASVAGGDAVAALRRVVADFVSWHCEHHRTARVVQYELSALPDDARTVVVGLRRRIERHVEELIRRGTADGVMAVDAPRQVARAVLSLSVDVARWFDPAGPESPDDLGRLYADLATRMVGATPPPQPSTGE